MRVKIATLFVLLIIAASCKSSAPKETNETTLTYSSENTLEWAGTYTGVFPCADCEGIKVELNLNSDLTYSEHYNYLGTDKSYRESGYFRWNLDGSKITLVKNGLKDTDTFIVGKNKLIRLDSEGHIIKKNGVNLFELKKKK